MLSDGMLVAIALGALGLGMLYALAGSFRSPLDTRWSGWTAKSLLAAGAAYAIGLYLLLGLPGAVLLEMVAGQASPLPPDSAWPLAIFITQVLALLVVPSSLLLRLLAPGIVGWAHAGLAAAATGIATLIYTMHLVSSYTPGAT